MENNENQNGHYLHDRIVIGASAGGVEAVSNQERAAEVAANVEPIRKLVQSLN